MERKIITSNEIIYYKDNTPYLSITRCREKDIPTHLQDACFVFIQETNPAIKGFGTMLIPFDIFLNNTEKAQRLVSRSIRIYENNKEHFDINKINVV